MVTLLTEKFSSWTAKPVLQRACRNRPLRRAGLVVVDARCHANVFRLGNLGIARTNPIAFD